MAEYSENVMLCGFIPSQKGSFVHMNKLPDFLKEVLCFGYSNSFYEKLDIDILYVESTQH